MFFKTFSPMWLLWTPDKPGKLDQMEILIQ